MRWLGVLALWLATWWCDRFDLVSNRDACAALTSVSTAFCVLLVTVVIACVESLVVARWYGFPLPWSMTFRFPLLFLYSFRKPLGCLILGDWVLVLAVGGLRAEHDVSKFAVGVATGLVLLSVVLATALLLAGAIFPKVRSRLFLTVFISFKLPQRQKSFEEHDHDYVVIKITERGELTLEDLVGSTCEECVRVGCETYSRNIISRDQITDRDPALLLKLPAIVLLRVVLRSAKEAGDTLVLVSGKSGSVGGWFLQTLLEEVLILKQEACDLNLSRQDQEHIEEKLWQPHRHIPAAPFDEVRRQKIQDFYNHLQSVVHTINRLPIFSQWSKCWCDDLEESIGHIENDGPSEKSLDFSSTQRELLISYVKEGNVQAIAANCVCDANAADENGKPLLILAVERMHTGLVDCLLQKRASPASVDSLGNTGIHLAASKSADQCASNIVGLLLHASADAQQANHSGETPLFFAVHADNIAVTQVLLMNRADVDCRDTQGRTPLRLAVQQRSSRTATCLLKHRASPNASASISGQTALFAAAECGHADMINLLADASAEVDAFNKLGRTALMHAMIHCSEEHLCCIAKTLLQRQASIDIMRSEKDGTALCLAACKGNCASVSVLLKLRANPQAHGQGSTALKIAELCGHAFVVQVLTEAGVV